MKPVENCLENVSIQINIMRFDINWSIDQSVINRSLTDDLLIYWSVNVKHLMLYT